MNSAKLAFFGPLAEHQFAVAQRLSDDSLDILPVPGGKGMVIIRDGTADLAKRREGRELLVPFEHRGEFFFIASR